MKWKKVLCAVILSALWGGLACAQVPPDANQYVSKSEYEKLKQEMESLKAEMAAIRQERTSSAAQAEANQMREMDTLKAEVANLKQQRTAQSADVNQAIDELTAQLQKVKNEGEITRPGTTKFLLTGYAFAGFTDKKHENSTFSAGFNPIFLWEINDKLFAEGELEFSLESPGGTESSETATSLEYIDINYILNDYMTIGAGKFLLPIGIFNQKLHPAWINKLPDRPLPFDDEVGIAQEAGIGVFVRGVVPAGKTKFNYDAYVVNGPALITDNSEKAGMLDFDNFEDNNHNKAVGGRIGFLPVPELEMGYSIQAGKVSPSGFKSVDMLVNALDASYMKQIDSLRGTIDARGEFVWSDVGDATYGPTSPEPFDPLNFDNDRNGYYTQVAYRPTLVNDKVLKNLEFILRYDALNVPGDAPGSVDEHRWTPGVDYWVTPNMVLKLAYQVDHKSGEDNQNALLLQAALGF